MAPSRPRIVYALTDEAPLLASHSLLPILRAFAGAGGVEVQPVDVSLAARILARFAEQHDGVTELRELVETPAANIVKLPGISASVAQLEAAIAELQAAGLAIPSYPREPADDEEAEIRTRYEAVLGSAVNAVLRRGTMERRVPAAVKARARRRPHTNGPWSPDSRSHVATMAEGDFRSTEQSQTIARDGVLRIEQDGVLRKAVAVRAGDVVDCAVMRRASLEQFLANELEDARRRDVLFSLQLKSTVMRVADPIVFGHAVRAFLAPVFEAHGEALRAAGVEPRHGIGAVERLPEIELAPAFDRGPRLAMVDASRGITSLHAPGRVSIGAAMAAAIRASGQLLDADGAARDAKFVIPDHSYAALYAETIRHCRAHGAFDPARMGTVIDVGLAADGAEEYGSQDTTFEIDAPGAVRVVDDRGAVLFEHDVQAGDVWRLCRTTDEAIRSWLDLAAARARDTELPTVLWLDETRPHDRELLAKASGAFEAMDVTAATRFTLDRARQGEDTVAVTGNVLRDYVTELFPTLEAGDSSKVQSTTHLLQGGSVFEAGAGGTAPRLVPQLLEANHLRWDSVGELVAFAGALEHAEARDLARALQRAVTRLLENDRAPSREVGELDTRGQHFYVALYWAQELEPRLASLAERLGELETSVVDELRAVQGEPVDIGGYYRPDPEKIAAAMRPSRAFNEALESVEGKR